MVTRKIAELKTASDEMILKLSEEYIQSYVNAFQTLTDMQPTNKTPVFADFTLKTLKDEVFDILKEIQKLQRLPVVNFAAGGIATPTDAAIMMQLGSDGVFVGSGIFKSTNPEQRAKAIVESVAHYDDASVVAEVSKNLGDAMVGIDIDEIPKEQRLQERGW